MRVGKQVCVLTTWFLYLRSQFNTKYHTNLIKSYLALIIILSLLDKHYKSYSAWILVKILSQIVIMFCMSQIVITLWMKLIIYQCDFTKSKNSFKTISMSTELQQHISIIFLNQSCKAQYHKINIFMTNRTKFCKSITNMQFINLFDSYLQVIFNQHINWYSVWFAISNVFRILISNSQVYIDSENDENRTICIKLKQNLWLLYA